MTVPWNDYLRAQYTAGKRLSTLESLPFELLEPILEEVSITIHNPHSSILSIEAPLQFGLRYPALCSFVSHMPRIRESFLLQHSESGNTNVRSNIWARPGGPDSDSIQRLQIAEALQALHRSWSVQRPACDRRRVEV